MKNIQIGAALKTMRKNRGWTIHDVVVQLNGGERCRNAVAVCSEACEGSKGVIGL